MRILYNLSCWFLAFFSLEMKLQANNFYISGSAGASTVTDLKMKVNDDMSFKGQDVQVNNVVESVLGGFLTVNTQTTQTTNYVIALKDLVFSSRNKYNMTFSSAIGYKFLDKFRVESEYRYLRFKSHLTGGMANANVDVNVLAEVFPTAEAVGEPMFVSEQSQNINLPLDLSGLLNGQATGLLPDSSQSVPVVSFTHGTHLHMINFLYEDPIYKNINVFAGFGLGYGFLSFYDANYPEDSSVQINKLDSRFFAYQYKIGIFYQYNKLDFIFNYTNINTVSNINIGTFTYNPLNFNMLEFGVRYNF